MSEIDLQAGRMKKVLRGVAGGFAGRILTLIAPFLVMPALLTDLGERGFGIWATAVSLTTMAAFLDFGMGNAVLTGLSKALATNALREARAVIVTGYIVLFTIAGVLVGLLLVGTALFAPMIVPSFGEQDLAILRAILLAFFLSIPISLVQRLLFAQQKIAQANAWMIAGSALSVSMCFLAIRGGLSAGSVTFLYAIGVPTTLLLATLAFFLSNPHLRPLLNDYDPAIARRTFKSGFGFLVLSILTSVGLNIDQVLISAMFGAEQVINYTVPYRLASLLMMVVTILYIPLWPANAEAMARSEWTWVRRNNLRMSLFGSALVAISGLCLYLSSDWIIMFWMGRDFPGQSEVLAASAILAVVMSLSSPYSMVLNSIGKAGIQSIAWLAFIFVSMLLKFQTGDPEMLFLFPAINAAAFVGIVLPIVVTSSLKLARGCQ